MTKTMPENTHKPFNVKQKILVKLPNYAGDIVMSFPALRILRNTLADYEIVLLTENSLSDLLYGQDFYDKLESPLWNPHHLSPLVISKYIKKIGEFNIAISLTRQLRFTLAFLIAGIPNRTGCNRFPSSIGLNKGVADPEKERSRIVGKRYYVELINRILEKMSQKRSIKVPRVTAKVDPLRKKEIEKLLGKNWEKNFYTVVPGSAASIYGLLKRWPLGNFMKLTQRLHLEKPELAPLFIFGPGEEDLYEQVENVYKKDLPLEIILIKPGSIRHGHVMAIIEKSEFLVSNDTGPRHIALALEKKVVSIFGPTSVARSTYAANLELPVWINVGCNLDDCKIGKSYCKEKRICMTSITPGLVCEKIMDFVYQEPKKRK